MSSGMDVHSKAEKPPLESKHQCSFTKSCGSVTTRLGTSTVTVWGCSFQCILAIMFVTNKFLSHNCIPSDYLIVNLQTDHIYE